MTWLAQIERYFKFESLGKISKDCNHNRSYALHTIVLRFRQKINDFLKMI
jgi:hypothetical protein